jgi:hypothetical protein
MSGKNNWSLATEDFQQIVLSFFKSRGLNVEEDGTVKVELLDKVRQMMPKAICHYLSEKLTNHLSSIGFLSNIKFSIHEIANECSLFMLAKHPKVAGYISLGKLSFEFDKPGDVGNLVLSTKNSSDFKIPFKSFWGIKRGFKLETDVSNKIKVFCMKEYDSVVAKYKIEPEVSDEKVPIL